MVGSRKDRVSAPESGGLGQVNFKKARTGKGPSFTDSRIRSVLFHSPASTVAFDLRQLLVNEREDVCIQCKETGRSYLHLVMDRHEIFRQPAALPVVYQLAYMGTNVNARDESGETVLHKVCRLDGGAVTILVALMRNGIDLSIKNHSGQTAEDVLITHKPPGWEELHLWYKKLYPGLCTLILEREAKEVPLERIEHLLNSWCKVRIFNVRSQCNLHTLAQIRAKDSVLAKLLEKHLWTNEFVHATLAGLPECMRLVVKDAKASKKKIDYDTVDVSYQLGVKEPAVGQPLTAAAWEQNNYEVIDYLMSLDPDVCVSYSNQHPDINYPKPLFYQTLLGQPRVEDLRIMLRVVECGDLRCKTDTCTNFLHECVNYDLPLPFMKKLLSLEMDISEREVMGRTPRDMALERGKLGHVHVLDAYVGNLVKTGATKVLEMLAYNSYRLDDVRIGPSAADSRISPSITLLQYAQHLRNGRMVKFFSDQLPTIKKKMAELWTVIEKEDVGALTKFMGSKDNKVALQSRDECGRSILLQAMVKMSKTMIRAIIKKLPRMVESFDNFMFSGLHYAFLLYEEDKEVANFLIASGASTDWCCVRGKAPCNYQKGMLPNNEFYTFQRVIKDYALTLFLSRTNFQLKLTESVKGGDLEKVMQLVVDLKPYAPISKFSCVLFDSIDAKQERMALYLIENGCYVDIDKQYDTHVEGDPLCAMMECYHPKTSLKGRAIDIGLTSVVNAIDARVATGLAITGDLEVTKL